MEPENSVERLRTAVYESTDPADSPLLDELLAAECMEVSRGQPDQPSTAGSGGVLWKTAPATALSHRGVAMGPQTTGLSVTVRLRMAHLPTSIVHLLDAAQHPLVSVTLHNSRSSTARLRLTSVIEGYSAHATDTVEVPPTQDAELQQLPTFFPERLASLSEVCRASLHVHLDDLDGKTEQQRTFPLWMLPRTSALLDVPDPTSGLPRDLRPYLAAWVTPNVPAVFELLRKAAAKLPGATVASYQVDERGVQAQVKAIYDALRSAGLSYVNSVLSLGPMNGVLAQRIRLPRESIAQRSANCIDGTVLFASLLEAASLHPALVLVPGHAFLAWEISEGSDRWDFLETTMLGTHNFDKAQTQGRKLAGKYQELAKLRPAAFYRLPLRTLRSQGIWPME